MLLILTGTTALIYIRHFQTFPVKSQIVNILVSMGYRVTVVTTQKMHCRMKATNWYGSVLIKNKIQPFLFIRLPIKEKKKKHFIFCLLTPDPYKQPLWNPQRIILFQYYNGRWVFVVDLRYHVILRYDPLFFFLMLPHSQSEHTF